MASLTFSITITNGEGASASYQNTAAGQLPENESPLVVAQAVVASAFELVNEYAASLAPGNLETDADPRSRVR